MVSITNQRTFRRPEEIHPLPKMFKGQGVFIHSKEIWISFLGILERKNPFVNIKIHFKKVLTVPHILLTGSALEFAEVQRKEWGSSSSDPRAALSVPWLKVNPSSYPCNYKKDRHWKIRVFSFFTVTLVSCCSHHPNIQMWHLITINLPLVLKLFLSLRGIPIATTVIPSVVQVQPTPKSSPNLTSWGSHLSRCCNHLHVRLVCDNYGVPWEHPSKEHSCAAQGTWSSPTGPLGLRLGHPLDLELTVFRFHFFNWS